MSGFGSVDNPFNEAFGRIIEVHWRTGGRHVIGGTCDGTFGFNPGLGAFSATLGIINAETGEIFASDSVTLSSGESDTVTVTASGVLASGEGVALTPFADIMGDPLFGISGFFYAGHDGFSLVSSAVSNTGDLSPFGQFVAVSGPGNWTCTITFSPYAGPPFTSGIPGTISVVLSPP